MQAATAVQRIFGCSRTARPGELRVVSAPGSWCPAEVSTERLKAIVLRYARAKWDKSLAKARSYFILYHYMSVVCVGYS